MASPAADNVPNGVSTPPNATGGQNPSPAGSTTAAAAPPPAQPAIISATQPLPNGNGTGALNPAAHASHPSTSLQDNGTSKRPRDARLIHLLLANMGVTAYTERVPLQLLDFAYRYTSSILSDAIAYDPTIGQVSTSAAKKTAKEDDGVSIQALRTAIAARAAQQFSPALPKEFLIEVAAERNRAALPRIEREFGVRLPHERYCFTGVGWDVKEEWESEVEVEEEGDTSVTEGGPVGGSTQTQTQTQGTGDTVMGGMDDEDVDEEEFEDVMGTTQGQAKDGDTDMVNG